MKKPTALLLSPLLALSAAAAEGDTFMAGDTGHRYSYTVLDEDARTCMTTPGTDEDNPGNGRATLDRTTITIPEKVTYNGKEYTVVEIGDYGFSVSGNSSVTEFSLPETITRIGDYAFSGRRGLTTLNIPSKVTYIGKYAFDWCYLWKTELTLPETLTEIGASAFHLCQSLTSIHVPGTVRSISDFAFAECTGATSVTLGEGVETIGQYAFQDCHKITSIEIPEGVTTIRRSAFENCYRLTSISLPSTLESAHYSAFYMTSGNPDVITSITVKAVNPPTIFSNTFGEKSYANATLTVPDESVLAYQSDARWMEFLNVATLSGKEPDPLALELSSEAEEVTEGKEVILNVNLPVAWKSSDEDVAKVDPEGTVTPRREGTADITSFVPGYSDLRVTRTVTVKRDSSGILHIYEAGAE